MTTRLLGSLALLGLMSCVRAGAPPSGPIGPISRSSTTSCVSPPSATAATWWTRGSGWPARRPARRPTKRRRRRPPAVRRRTTDDDPPARQPRAARSDVLCARGRAAFRTHRSDLEVVDDVMRFTALSDRGHVVDAGEWVAREASGEKADEKTQATAPGGEAEDDR